MTVAAAGAAAASVGATAVNVGEIAATVDCAFDTAGATCVGAACGALEHATTTAHTRNGISLASRTRMAFNSFVPSALQAAAGDALQKMPLNEDEQNDHGRDRERAR